MTLEESQIVSITTSPIDAVRFVCCFAGLIISQTHVRIDWLVCTLRTTYTPVQPILQYNLYSGTTYTPAQPILWCNLYSGATYTPVQPILWYNLNPGAT